MVRISRVLWGALLFSTFIYALIIYLVSMKHPLGPFDVVARKPDTLVLYGMALVLFAAATGYSIAFRSRPLQLYTIVTCALYESCTIFGLIAAFLHLDWRLFLAPWALSLIGFWRVFPSAETPVRSLS